MNSFDDEIRDALLWNVPRLRRASKAAQRFVDVFYFTARDEEMPELGDHPLSRSSEALLALGRDDAKAIQIFNRMVNDGDGLERLLGACLLAWSYGAKDQVHIERAADIVAELEDRALRSHCYTKLMTFELEAGRRQRALELWTLALKSSSWRSSLHQQLVLVGFNFFERRSSLDRLEPKRSGLADYPWIEDLVLTATRDHVVDVALSSAPERRPVTLRFGRGPIEDLLAAEQQAVWAGAVWLLGLIRRPLAALLSGKPNRSEDDARNAALHWTLGDGKELDAFVSVVEPDFGAHSCDEVMRELHFGRRTRSRQTFWEFALATWDLLSEDSAMHLLSTLQPEELFGLQYETQRRLFGVLATRVPGPWSGVFASFSDERQRDLASAIPPAAVRFLQAEVLDILFRRTTALISESPTTPFSVYNLHVAIAERQPATNPDLSLIMRAAAAERVELAWSWQGVRTHLDLSTTTEELIDQSQTELSDARAGRRSLGNFDTRVQLAKAICLAAESASDAAIDALTRFAIESWIPSDRRLAGLRALELVARTKGLPEETYDRLLQAAPVRPDPFWNTVPNDVIQAAIAWIRSHRRDALPDVASLVETSRHRDWRVRQTSIQTCGGFMRKTSADESSLAAVIFGGLFDEVQGVVRTSVQLVPSLFAAESILARPAIRRLVDLLRMSERGVRVSVLETARELPDGLEEAQAIRAAGLGDRSFLVRDAATR